MWSIIRQLMCKHTWRYGGFLPGPPGKIFYKLVCVRCGKEMAAVGIADRD